MILNTKIKNDDYVLSVIDGCANLKKFEKDAKTEQPDCFLNPKS